MAEHPWGELVWRLGSEGGRLIKIDMDLCSVGVLWYNGVAAEE